MCWCDGDGQHWQVLTASNTSTGSVEDNPQFACVISNSAHAWLPAKAKRIDLLLFGQVGHWALPKFSLLVYVRGAFFVTSLCFMSGGVQWCVFLFEQFGWSPRKQAAYREGCPDLDKKRGRNDIAGVFCGCRSCSSRHYNFAYTVYVYLY